MTQVILSIILSTCSFGAEVDTSCTVLPKKVRGPVLVTKADASPYVMIEPEKTSLPEGFSMVSDSPVRAD
jgi:hypothetical protein